MCILKTNAAVQGWQETTRKDGPVEEAEVWPAMWENTISQMIISGQESISA